MMGDEKCYENKIKQSQETGNARDGVPFEIGWTEPASWKRQYFIKDQTEGKDWAMQINERRTLQNRGNELW